MGLYDGIKDVAKVVQKADNIELYQKLIDLSAQALDMQNTINVLTDENKKLKKHDNIANRIIRHYKTYVTLEDDENNIKYCSYCWDADNKLIQMNEYSGETFRCNKCGNRS